MIELVAGPWGNGGICACRRDDGPVVLLSGALPGERVVAEVTTTAKSFWRARVDQVLEPSPDRVPPPWPQGLELGAADWLHVAPKAARAAKADVVLGLLEHATGLRPSLGVAPLGGGGPLGWRTKVELAVSEAGRAGMVRVGTHQFEPLVAMPLAVDAISELGLFDRRWPPGSRLTAVAPSAGRAFWLDDAARQGRRRREVVRVAGRAYHYELDALGFWQIHRAAPEALAEAVLTALRPQAGDAIWDLYAGAGLFTLPLAAAGARVSAVEGSRRAVADLRANIKRAGLELARADSASVARALRGPLGRTRPGAVLLDPPRSGAGRAVMSAVAAARPSRIAYLSCEPAALARDLAALTEAGYQLTGLKGFDLFPGTHHVEILALVERHNPKDVVT
jgi:tRNA/tmRNA/rRNA uracil-C5-methylase (TrmA/RlmC/RlmD family)